VIRCTFKFHVYLRVVEVFQISEFEFKKIESERIVDRFDDVISYTLFNIISELKEINSVCFQVDCIVLSLKAFFLNSLKAKRNSILLKNLSSFCTTLLIT
jgi:hypothetical protein